MKIHCIIIRKSNDVNTTNKIKGLPISCLASIQRGTMHSPPQQRERKLPERYNPGLPTWPSVYAAGCIMPLHERDVLAGVTTFVRDTSVDYCNAIRNKALKGFTKEAMDTSTPAETKRRRIKKTVNDIREMADYIEYMCEMLDEIVQLLVHPDADERARFRYRLLLEYAGNVFEHGEEKEEETEKTEEQEKKNTIEDSVDEAAATLIDLSITARPPLRRSKRACLAHRRAKQRCTHDHECKALAKKYRKK
jgi:hypothetical protein